MSRARRRTAGSTSEDRQTGSDVHGVTDHNPFSVHANKHACRLTRCEPCAGSQEKRLCFWSSETSEAVCCRSDVRLWSQTSVRTCLVETLARTGPEGRVVPKLFGSSALSSPLEEWLLPRVPVPGVSPCCVHSWQKPGTFLALCSSLPLASGHRVPSALQDAYPRPKLTLLNVACLGL